MSVSPLLKQASEDAAALARLELELGRREVSRKARPLAWGMLLGIAAGVLGFFALGFGLGAAAAALALVLPVWLAVLVVGAALLIVVAVLGFVARSVLRRNAPYMPREAIREARLTISRLRELAASGDGDGRT